MMMRVMMMMTMMMMSHTPSLWTSGMQALQTGSGELHRMQTRWADAKELVWRENVH